MSNEWTAAVTRQPPRTRGAITPQPTVATGDAPSSLTIADIDTHIAYGTATLHQAHAFAEASASTTFDAVKLARESAVTGSRGLRALAGELDHARTVALNGVLRLSSASDVVNANALDRRGSDLALALVSARDGARELARVLARDLAGDLAPASDLVNALAHDRARARDLADIVADDARRLVTQAGLIIYCLVALWAVPIANWTDVDLDGLDADLVAERTLGAAGLLAEPRQEESRSFEQVWSIIQRTIDTGAIPTELEADLLLLHDMVARARQLVVANGDEIVEYASRELDRLLPEVLDATLPGTGHPAGEALALSASRAPELEQLAALSTAAQTIEATLAPLAEQIPPRPYAPDLMDAIEHQTARLNATIPRLAAMEDAVDRARQLKTVRAVYRAGQWVASTKALTELQDLMANTAGQAGHAIPGVLTDARQTIAALLSAAIVRWLYARQRKKNPALPANLQLPPGAEPPSVEA
jgi:hypothetical protein